MRLGVRVALSNEAVQQLSKKQLIEARSVREAKSCSRAGRPESTSQEVLPTHKMSVSMQLLARTQAHQTLKTATRPKHRPR
jgi:hypothetical protein